jgi:hypothetical protein
LTSKGYRRVRARVGAGHWARPARLELAVALHAFGRAIRLRHPQGARTALGEALQLARVLAQADAGQAG